MNNQAVAKELVAIAKLLSGKGEVPEAFKKQWKNKDKDNDGKENEPKPDFVKKIEEKKKKSSIESELLAATRELMGAATFKCPECGSKVLENTGYCLKCKKKVKKAASDWPYAALTFESNRIKFRIGFGPDGGEDSMGAEPYRGNIKKAIDRVFKALKMHGVDDENVEVV